MSQLSLFEGRLVLVDPFARELFELQVHVLDAGPSVVLRRHRFAVLQRLVDLLPPVEHGRQFVRAAVRRAAAGPGGRRGGRHRNAVHRWRSLQYGSVVRVTASGRVKKKKIRQTNRSDSAHAVGRRRCSHAVGDNVVPIRVYVVKKKIVSMIKTSRIQRDATRTVLLVRRLSAKCSRGPLAAVAARFSHTAGSARCARARSAAAVSRYVAHARCAPPSIPPQRHRVSSLGRATISPRKIVRRTERYQTDLGRVGNNTICLPTF